MSTKTNTIEKIKTLNFDSILTRAVTAKSEWPDKVLTGRKKIIYY